MTNLSPEQRIHGVVVSVDRVHDALRAEAAGLQSRLAVDIQDEIETFGRVTARALSR